MKASRVTTNTAERRRILTDAFIKSHLEQAQQLAESDPFLKSRLDKYQAKKESSGMDSSPKPTQNVEMSEEQRRQQDLDRATANILESMKDRPFQKLTLVPDGSESKNNKTGLGPRTFTEPVELTRQREELEKNNSSTGESNPNIRNEVRAEEFADARARLEAETLDRLTTEKEYEQVHDGPLAGEVQVAGPRRMPTPEDIARAKEEVESNYTPEQLERGALEIEAIKREQDRKIAEADAPLIAEAQGSYTPQQLEQGAAEIDRIRQGQSNGTITFDGSSDSAATNEHASQTVPIVDDGPEGLTEEQRALWKAMHTTEQPEMRSDAVIQTSADATSPVTPHRMDGSSEFAVPMSDPDAKTVPENSPVTSSDDKLTEEQRALRDAMQGTNLSTGARMSESVISAKRLSGDRDFAAGRTEEPTEKTDKVASTMKLDEMVEPEPQVAVVGTDAFWDKLTEVAQANAPAINAETAATAKLFVNNLKDKEKVTPTNTVRGRVLNSARRLGGAAALTALLAAGSAGITSQPSASVPVTPQPTEMSMGSTTVNEMTSVVDQHSQTGGPEKEVSVDEAVTKAKQETGGGLVGLIRKTLFGVKNG